MLLSVGPGTGRIGKAATRKEFERGGYISFPVYFRKPYYSNGEWRELSEKIEVRVSLHQKNWAEHVEKSAVSGRMVEVRGWLRTYKHEVEGEQYPRVQYYIEADALEFKPHQNGGGDEKTNGRGGTGNQNSDDLEEGWDRPENYPAV